MGSNNDHRECVGVGWQPMVQGLINLCDFYGVKVMQVKEKFGGLRFYVDCAPDVVAAVIDACEHHSFNVCEDCGAQGNQHILNGWTRTLCDKHAGIKP
jgi:hypothetical protein